MNVTVPGGNETRYRGHSQNAADVSRPADVMWARSSHRPAGSQTHTHQGEWDALVDLKGEEVRCELMTRENKGYDWKIYLLIWFDLFGRKS